MERKVETGGSVLKIIELMFCYDDSLYDKMF